MIRLPKSLTVDTLLRGKTLARIVWGDGRLTTKSVAREIARGRIKGEKYTTIRGILQKLERCSSKGGPKRRVRRTTPE